LKKRKVKKTIVQRFKKKKKKKKKKEKKKVLVSVLKLRNFSWINCILLGVLVRLYLDDMALEANILLLLLLE
jgi:F0F1-type ATP synthase assembly protein I